jgi:oxygen-independent coproporphyrinogen-3 oxidase
MRHVYLHVPFCRRRCTYCDFSIAVRRDVPAERYVSAVSSELERRQATDWWDNEPLETLYLGGGTPSLLPPPSLASLIRDLTARCATLGAPAVPDAELTIEVNPEDVTDEAAATWVGAGVNRVSLGVQSFDPSVLEWMHRSHSAEQAEEAVRVLRAAGIGSVSLDLIFALPVELKRNWSDDLRRALEVEPDHLSLYGLTVEPRTPLARRIARGATSTPVDGTFAEQFLEAHDALTSAGFEHYEVSNYSRPGHRSRHNQAYWIGRPYLGLGPSAHGYDGARRYWNRAPWSAYEQVLKAGGDPTESVEHLTTAQRRLETVYLGLRTVEGLPSGLPAGWPEGWRQSAAQRGWLDEAGGRVRLTPEGWLRLDAIVAVLTTSA